MADPQTELKQWLAIKLSPRGTAKKLADFLGVDATAVSRMKNIEPGKEPRKVTAEEVQQIAAFFGESPPGYNFAPKSFRLTSSYDPDVPDQDIHEERGAALVDGSVVFEKTHENGIPELAASPGMGVGNYDDRPVQIYSNGIAAGHPVLNEWVIPPEFIRHALGAMPAKVVVMSVIGHSMSPLLEPNDRIFVDVSQQSWVGDAVYVIDDGDGVLRAKTLRKVSGTNPPQFKVVSEAAPADIEILEHSQFRIVGRAVGRISRL